MWLRLRNCCSQIYSLLKTSNQTGNLICKTFFFPHCYSNGVLALCVKYNRILIPHLEALNLCYLIHFSEVYNKNFCFEVLHLLKLIWKKFGNSFIFLHLCRLFLGSIIYLQSIFTKGISCRSGTQDIVIF